MLLKYNLNRSESIYRGPGTNMACQIVGTITTHNFLLQYFYIQDYSEFKNLYEYTGSITIAPNVDTTLVYIIVCCVFL